LKFAPTVLVLIIGATLAVAVAGMPAFGSRDAPGYTHVVPRYLERAQQETGVNNIVTAIVVYYRGYDTFGEVTVIFTAGIAVIALLGRK
jgi:multicomponent Na+:H+ antiporter subunit B